MNSSFFSTIIHWKKVRTLASSFSALLRKRMFHYYIFFFSIFIGYKLGPELYEKLRNVLPIVFHDLLPANHEEVHTLVPNRGEILDFNRQVPLSRPLFDGFGSINVDSTTKPTIENKKSIGSGSASDSSTQSNVVMERLPNGWSKKAVKRLSGTSKGNKNIVIHKYNVSCCI